jgi:hypothetical protein
MRERGVSLGDLLIRYRWLYMTAISFLGTYGWMALYSPAWFYLLMALGWVIFIGCVLLATFNTPSPSRRVFYAIVWLFLPLAVAASAYHSWTSDFQAQGRYLFPLLPILFYLVNAVGTASRRLFFRRRRGLCSWFLHTVIHSLA